MLPFPFNIHFQVIPTVNVDSAYLVALCFTSSMYNMSHMYKLNLTISLTYILNLQCALLQHDVVIEYNKFEFDEKFFEMMIKIPINELTRTKASVLSVQASQASRQAQFQDSSQDSRENRSILIFARYMGDQHSKMNL